jgi:DNA (cytosine-5)-methyltransferase 1
MSIPTGKTFGEFFAGIGLMRIGLERAGWRIAFANDIDEDKQRMYRDHFGDSEEFVLGDVHKLDASKIPDISLATASFPCNDLSLAGARRGLAGDQSSSF